MGYSMAKIKRTRLALRGVFQPGPVFGEDGRGSGMASSGSSDGWRESPRPAATCVRRAEPDKRQLRCWRPRMPNSAAPKSPWYVKRAVSRDGHGSPDLGDSLLRFTSG